MAFGVIGYIWALLGCASVLVFGFGIGGALMLYGHFTERRRAQPTVVSVPLERDPAGAMVATRSEALSERERAEGESQKS